MGYRNIVAKQVSKRSILEQINGGIWLQRILGYEELGASFLPKSRGIWGADSFPQMCILILVTTQRND